MSEDSNSSIVTRGVEVVLRVVILVLSIFALYLCLTALPAFLGLAGVLSRPGSPAPIADALARLTLALVFLGVIVGMEKLEQRLESGEA